MLKLLWILAAAPVEDATGIVTFLASRAGAYLTGTVIPVDGGLSGCS